MSRISISSSWKTNMQQHDDFDKLTQFGVKPERGACSTTARTWIHSQLLRIHGWEADIHTDTLGHSRAFCVNSRRTHFAHFCVTAVKTRRIRDFVKFQSSRCSTLPNQMKTPHRRGWWRLEKGRKVVWKCMRQHFQLVRHCVRLFYSPYCCRSTIFVWHNS